MASPPAVGAPSRPRTAVTAAAGGQGGDWRRARADGGRRASAPPPRTIAPGAGGQRRRRRRGPPPASGGVYYSPPPGGSGSAIGSGGGGGSSPAAGRLHVEGGGRRRDTPVTSGDLGGEERLQKVLSRAGVCSRRAGEAAIAAGRVAVDGVVVTDVGAKVVVGGGQGGGGSPVPVITVDGRRVRDVGAVVAEWVLLHKPRDLLCTSHDEAGRRTVVDAVPGGRDRRLLPVGRLDRDSTGLLLLTNDNAWINKLTHPKHGHTKTYVVDVTGRLAVATAQQLSAGILLEGERRPTAPADITMLGPSSVNIRGTPTTTTRLSITLTEGRNRQLRRMFDAVGHPVVRLHRVAFAGLGLGTLGRGEWRPLTAAEVERVKKGVASSPAAAKGAAPSSHRQGGAAPGRASPLRRGGGAAGPMPAGRSRAAASRPRDEYEAAAEAALAHGTAIAARRAAHAARAGRAAGGEGKGWSTAGSRSGGSGRGTQE